MSADGATPAGRDEAGPPLSRARRATFLAVGILGSLLVVELAARLVEVFVPPLVVDYGLGFDPKSRVFVTAGADANLRVVAPEKRETFVYQQVERDKPAGTFRVVVIGESSVNLLDGQLRSVARALNGEALGQTLRTELLNLGGHGYGSHRLVPVLLELLEYRPDLVIIYCGNNEFEELEQLDLARLDTLGVQTALSHLAIVRVVRDLLTRYQVAALRSEHNDRILASSRPDHARAWRHVFTADEVAERMAAFEQNLHTMVEAARGAGAAVVLGTLPSNLVQPLLPEPAWSQYGAARALMQRGEYAAALALGRRLLAEAIGRHQASDVENEIIRRVADEQAVPVVDMAATVAAAEPHGIPGETLFADHCHLNDVGKALWAKTFLPVIRAQRDLVAARSGGAP